MFIKFKNSSERNICSKCERDLTGNRYHVYNNETSIQTCRESILYDIGEICPRINCNRLTIIINDCKKTKFSKAAKTNLLNILNALIYTQTDLIPDAKLSPNRNYLAISINGKCINYSALLSVLMYFIKITETLNIEFKFDPKETKSEVNKQILKYISKLIESIKDDENFMSESDMDNLDWGDSHDQETVFYFYCEIVNELDQISDALNYLYKHGGIQKLTNKLIENSGKCPECYNESKNYNGIIEFYECVS